MWEQGKAKCMEFVNCRGILKSFEGLRNKVGADNKKSLC